jgi:hypothetical protein
VGAATGASVTQISKASELMSKLGELSQTSPTKFTAVTNAIANKLAAQAMLERQELARRSSLQGELARLEKAEQGVSGTATSSPSMSPLSLANENVVSPVTSSGAASSTASGVATTPSWTENALAGRLSESLALVNEALGLSD